MAEDLCHRASMDWASVARIAASEGVAPIVGINLASCDPGRTGVPVEVTARLQRALFENVGLKAARHREFTEQLLDLDIRGYDVLLLKSAGLEAAGIYQHPWATCARDMDIVLRPRHEGPESLRNAKFRGVLNDTYGVENGDCTGHHDLSLNGIVNWPADDLWRAARSVLVDKASAASAYVLSPEDQLWTLCLNSCRKRFFRLKTLFDIAETVAHYPDLDWDYFVRRVRMSDSEGIVFAALRTADAMLGLPSAAYRRYSPLLSRRRAFVLASIVTLLSRSNSNPRIARTMLQYAGFTARQRWRSVRLSVCHRLPSRSPEERAEAHLPGE